MRLSPKTKKSFSKKAYEGEFLEDLIQKSFILRKQINKLFWMCRDRLSSTQLRLSLGN